MISKIIGLDSGTRKRAIASIVTASLDLLSVFGVLKLSSEQYEAVKNFALVAITAIVWYIGFYYNECTSPENCAATGEMRAAKLKDGPDYVVTEDMSGDEVEDDNESQEC